MTFLTADDSLVLVALGIGLIAIAVALRGRRESRAPAGGDSQAITSGGPEPTGDARIKTGRD